MKRNNFLSLFLNNGNVLFFYNRYQVTVMSFFLLQISITVYF